MEVGCESLEDHCVFCFLQVSSLKAQLDRALTELTATRNELKQKIEDWGIERGAAIADAKMNSKVRFCSTFELRFCPLFGCLSSDNVLSDCRNGKRTKSASVVRWRS